MYYSNNYAYPDQDYAGADPAFGSTGDISRIRSIGGPDVAGVTVDSGDAVGEVLSATETLIASVGPSFSPYQWSNYLGLWPIAPTPTDGGCVDGASAIITDSTNQYTYWGRSADDSASDLDDPQTYQVTFCIGAPVGGYPAGQLKATPSGIIPN